MSLCLNLSRARGIFALARIGCRRQPSRREDLCGQASNRARRWNLKLGAKAEGLRGLHTSASLFGTNVLLKLHYSQCIPSLDATVLHKLLTNITIVCIFSSIVPRPPPSKMSSLTVTVKLRVCETTCPAFHGDNLYRQWPWNEAKSNSIEM